MDLVTYYCQKHDRNDGTINYVWNNLLDWLSKISNETKGLEKSLRLPNKMSHLLTDAWNCTGKRKSFLSPKHLIPVNMQISWVWQGF